MDGQEQVQSNCPKHEMNITARITISVEYNKSYTIDYIQLQLDIRGWM